MASYFMARQRNFYKTCTVSGVLGGVFTVTWDRNWPCFSSGSTPLQNWSKLLYVFEVRTRKETRGLHEMWRATVSGQRKSLCGMFVCWLCSFLRLKWLLTFNSTDALRNDAFVCPEWNKGYLNLDLFRPLSSAVCCVATKVSICVFVIAPTSSEVWFHWDQTRY